MRKFTTRRTFARLAVAGAVSAALTRVLPARGDAPEFHYKLGNDLPAIHPNTVRSQEAAKRILEESGGRFALDVYPNSALGSDTSMLGQLRSGALEFFALAGDIFSTVLPISDLTSIAFAFKDYDTVWPAVDGDLGAFIDKAVAGVNIHVIGKWSDLGFRQITTSTKPIVTPDDLKGMKIRVPVSPMRLSMFKALGAAPTSINFSEVYSALQTHLVDGQETPLVVIEATKIYEVQKYCSLTRHVWSGTMPLANMAAWRRLPENLQEIVSRNLDDAAIKSRDDVAKLDVSVRERLKAAGLVFNDPDRDPFRAELKKAGFYAEWRGRFGDEAWKLLEKFSGPLG